MHIGIIPRKTWLLIGVTNQDFKRRKIYINKTVMNQDVGLKEGEH